MAAPYILILAAGNSTRLKSRYPKVLHPLCGRPMIDYVLGVARALKPRKIALVVGFGRDRVRAHLQGQRGLVLAHQKERLGTAHAVQAGLKALGAVSGEVVILSGDVPLLRAKTLKTFLRAKTSGPLSLVTALLPNPTGYGRVLRDESGGVLGVVEEKNANPAERQINEINGGIYRAQISFLRNNLSKIKKDPKKREYYLTDLVAVAVSQHQEVLGWQLPDSREILGANTRAELAYLNKILHDELVRFHLNQGVGMQDPDHVYLDHGVTLGSDTFLGPGVQIMEGSRIAADVRIEAGSILRNVRVEEGAQICAYSYLEDCVVRKGARVGPFARIRPGSEVGAGARVGNFVEMKKTRLGAGSKANHLSYLGDCRVGKDVNIGAGTITCNYDGKKKYQTLIQDGSFIGSDSQLVAPVKVGKKSYVGSGTTVTRDVPSGALALSRVPQRNIKDWLKKK